MRVDRKLLTKGASLKRPVSLLARHIARFGWWSYFCQIEQRLRHECLTD